MILGETRQSVDIISTLDDLFRRAGVRHPDAVALVDPPNRTNFTDGSPRTLSYAQADHAISAIASRLRGLGLQSDAVVAVQLPNTVDSIITFLGVLRAGMIAAPLPLLWRRRELVDAVGRVGAKAFVTCARVGNSAHAEIAVHTAAALFSIRHVCSFGRDLPDGVVSFDDIYSSDTADRQATLVRSECAAAHVAAVTFDVSERGVVPVARSHIELISGALAVVLESGMGPDGMFLSTIPPSTFAGLTLTIAPWLLSGGTLHLHHAFDAGAFSAQLDAIGHGMVMLPAPAVITLKDAGAFTGRKCAIGALWRAPERLKAAEQFGGTNSVVDILTFGEIGIVAMRRDAHGRPVPIPHGVLSVPRGAIGAMTVIETTRSDAGTLMVRGPMVPRAAFPPGAEHSHAGHLPTDQAGFIDTGFRCSLDVQTQTLAVTAPPAGIFCIGGYYLRPSELDVRKVTPDASVVPLPDRNLGHRLAGTALDRKAAVDGLHAQGVNALVSGAFRARSAGEAA